MPIRVLSLEIREAHYAEVAAAVKEGWRRLLCQPNVERQRGFRGQATDAQASMVNESCFHA